MPSTKRKPESPESKPPQARVVIRARAFLAAYRHSCNITAAAESAGIRPRQIYRWIEKYPKFRAAFERAQQEAARYLESVAIRRASDGWLEPIYYQGTECGTVRRFDGGLMQFLLRGALPEKYNRTAIEHSGPDGKPMQTTLTVEFVKPAPAPDDDP